MTVVINPDKTISINGIKTFLVSMSGICDPKWGTCSQSDVDKYRDFDIDFIINSVDNYRNKVIPTHEAAGIMFTRQTFDPIPDDIKNHPFFFGYLHCDEPKSTDTTLYSSTITQAQCIAKERCDTPFVWRDGKCYYPNEKPNVIRLYNNLHAADPAHPVLLNHWKNMTEWAPYCDILSWDTYTVGTRYANNNWAQYSREQAIYAYEIESEKAFFKGTSLDNINKPIWAVIQALGREKGEGGGSLYPLTPAEARLNTYSAVCMNVKGIRYWTANFGTLDINYGLATNPGLLAYYAQLSREMRSLNNALVAPTIAYKWAIRGLNPNTVTFSKSLTATLLGRTVENWSYILKQPSDTEIYLIVANKDSRPIQDVTISISGLSESLVAITQGLETSGSQAAGRVLPVENGQIHEPIIDGQAVQIYKISSGTDRPPETGGGGWGKPLLFVGGFLLLKEILQD